MKPACPLDPTALEMAVLPLNRKMWPDLTAGGLAKALIAYNEPPVFAPASDPDELMTVAEICAEFKISKGSVWNWARQGKGKLERIRIGERLVRFRRADVEKLAVHGAQPIATPTRTGRRARA